MVDVPKTEDDFASLSDEDFLKLNQQDFSGNMDNGETDFSEHKEKIEESANAEEVPKEPVDGDESPSDTSKLDESNKDNVADSSAEETSKEEVTEENVDDSVFSEKATDVPVQQQTGTDTKEEGKDPDPKVDPEPQTPGKETPAKAGYFKIPEGVTSEHITSAIGFYDVISKPFKADGKEITVRSPEDAVRLMQQGLNYSRRMQELKPMKQINRVMEDNNLVQDDLNFLIDLKKGNKDAILKLLKDHKIDIMDLDPEKETGYQTTNYAGDTQTNEFRDAIDNVMSTDQGQELITHIDRDWDKASKARLRENPTILGNLHQMKQNGVYERVINELEYQQGLGYLTNVPFLQAFDEVGAAMKKAGVFNSVPNDGNSIGDLSPHTQKQPVASGARKDSVQKKADPNPHLSSTPPSRQKPVVNDSADDFGKMSDEDFLKMAPPS